MVRPIILVAAAIPAIIAILISIPLITKPEIPFSAANPNDRVDIEYVKHQLITVSHGVTERTGAQKTEILEIRNNGDLRFIVTEDGASQPSLRSKISEDELRGVVALIKETGFIAIPSESFPVKEGVTNYQKSSVKVTLNGATTEVYWPEQNATDKFIPPIITLVETKLDELIDKIRE